jgi:predicted outer membrane repeat protein
MNCHYKYHTWAKSCLDQDQILFSLNGQSWVEVYNSSFRNLTQPAIRINGPNSYAVLDGCRFEYNEIVNSADLSTSIAGTAVQSYGTADRTLLVNNSYFAFNKAEKSYGSCIAIDNLPSNKSVIIQNSVFVQNVALAGGAIYSSSVTSLVNLINNVYVNNTAVQHGPDYATGRKISRFVDIPWQNSTGRPNTISLYSGDILPSVSISEFDAYGQTLVPGLLNARFAMVSMTINDTIVPTNATLTGDTKRILMSSITTFVAVKVLGNAPPPETLYDDPNNLPANYNKSFYDYDLTLFEINIRGEILYQLDRIPIQMLKCSQRNKRKQVSDGVSEFPQCIESNICVSRSCTLS